MDEPINELIRRAAAALRTAGAREVYVFGSAATDALREDSDIDMAVSGLPPEVFFKSMGQAHDILGRPLDLVDLDEQTPFTEYLRRKGNLRRVA